MYLSLNIKTVCEQPYRITTKPIQSNTLYRKVIRNRCLGKQRRKESTLILTPPPLNESLQLQIS